ncbi:MAG: VOC family protein [Solirubrobacteraceae bacterium]
MAIADQEEAAASVIGRAVAAAPDGLFGWAVAVEDVPAEAQRLGLEVTSIERDGLTARLTGVAQAMAEPWLPFFIQRDPGIENSSPPTPSGDAGAIAWIELAADPERLHAWLGGGEELPLRYAAGEAPGLRAVGLGSGAVIR